MKSYKRVLKTFIIITTVCIAFNVLAHDAWVEPAKGPVFHIYYGHKIPEAFDASKVASLKILDAKEQAVMYNRIKTDSGLDIKVQKGSPSLFVLEFDNGYWLTVNGERKNISKSQNPDGTDPAHNVKYAKTILNWQPWMSQPQGQRIEFVPVNVSHMPKAGEQLKLQLLLDGKPLSEQMVENNSNEQGPKTDADGYVTVNVLKGVNRFATDHDINQPDSLNATRLSITAVFVFDAK